MHDEADGESRVVQMPRMRDLAEGLRSYLKLAGVPRSELYASDETRKGLRWHDLGASGCTRLAVRGEEPLHIQYRAGHTSFGTTEMGPAMVQKKPKTTAFAEENLRRGRDSNPRRSFAPRPLSKRVPSATRSPLQVGTCAEFGAGACLSGAPRTRQARDEG